MVVRICALVLVFTASPRASAGPAEPLQADTGAADPLAEARRLFNERGHLAGAERAASAFTRADLSDEKRLGLALFGANSYALTYQLLPGDPPGDPIYLCKALALLEASEALATQPKEIERHRRLLDARRRTLEKNHPGFHCVRAENEDASPPPELRASPSPVEPVRQTPGTIPTTAESIPVRPAPRPSDLRRRAMTLTTIGGTCLGFGAASLALMGGLLAVQQDLRQQAEIDSAALPSVLSPEQGQLVSHRQQVFERVENLTIATGFVGTVMALTGVTLLARGLVLHGRMRVAPEVRAARAGLVVFGRF